MSYEQWLPVNDAIHGAVYDEHGAAYLVFVRSRPTAMVSTPRAMAQSADDVLFRIVEAASISPEEIVVTLQLSDRTLCPIRLTSVLELFPDALLKILTHVSLEATLPPPLREHMPEDYWQHLTDEKVGDAWLELKKIYRP